MFLKFFTTRKRKALQEREQARRFWKTEKNLSKSAAISRRSADILSQTLENDRDMRRCAEDFNRQVAGFQKTFDENRAREAELQRTQNRLSEWENDLRERQETNRKEEISIHIRRESVKKEEERVAKKDADLDGERQNIKAERAAMKDRVESAKKAEEKCNKERDAYEEKRKAAEALEKEYKAKIDDLDAREKECRGMEAALASERERFDAEKESWEETRGEIEGALEEKIREYDRKRAEMDAAFETVGDIVFDGSKEGKEAKIVVKEAIRASIKCHEESLQRFRELDEKYASGTFKGFSVPIDEISVAYEELKSQYAAVKEHAESTGLDFSIWLGKIEECILEADKNIKSFLFADGYRFATKGLSYCEGYEDVIRLFNEYAGASEKGEGEADGGADDAADDGWEDYYEILYGDAYDGGRDYTRVSTADLKKQYMRMAKKLHPDKAPEADKAECTERFKKLTEVWGILSDADKRAAYDGAYIENRKSHRKTED